MGIETLASHSVEKTIPQEYQETIANLSKNDVSEIYLLLVNEGDHETEVNKLVRNFTDQEKLEDYQKLLLAPANGIENVVGFFCSLLTKQGYVDIANGIKNINETPETLKALWDVFYNQLSPTQKLSVAVEYGTNTVALGQIAAKLAQILKIIKPLKKGTLLSKNTELILNEKNLSMLKQEALIKQSATLGKTMGAGITAEAITTSEDLQDYGNANQSAKN